MKIFFDNVSFENQTGPCVFAKRLAVQLSLMGYTIADPDDYDIHLAFIEPTRQTISSKPLIQRLDGIWFKPNEFFSKNAGIKRCYNAADAVVWQSEFDMNMIMKWWGKPKNGHIIRNGIKQKHVIIDHKLQTLVDKYDKVFVCSANWHAQKRLRANIDLYMHLRSNYYNNSCLIVLGKNPDVYIADPCIFYANSVAEDVYLQVYNVADWMLHLAWLDHCPNVVIEALSQGTPVICSNDGGTCELARIGGGIIINEQTSYNYELTDYDSPPQIDVTQVGKLPENFNASIANAFNIETIALKYDKLFKELIK